GLVAAAAGVLAFVRAGRRAGPAAPLTPVAPVGAVTPRAPFGMPAWFVSVAVSVSVGGVAGGVFGLLVARGLWVGSPRAAAASELVLACCFAAAFALYLRDPADARPDPTRLAGDLTPRSGVRSPGGSGGTPS
ncbi:serine/threonine protein kinase, partial [Frankia sp. AiPs1]|nr:serine/threonine protein kinase [Frankia sp. AiPs1]